MSVFEELAKEAGHLDRDVVQDTIGALATRRLLTERFGPTAQWLAARFTGVPPVQLSGIRTAVQDGGGLVTGIGRRLHLTPGAVDGPDAATIAKLAFEPVGNGMRIGQITAAAVLDGVLQGQSAYGVDPIEEAAPGTGEAEMRRLEAMAADLSQGQTVEASQLWLDTWSADGAQEAVEPDLRFTDGELPNWVSPADLIRLGSVVPPRWSANVSPADLVNRGATQMLGLVEYVIQNA